MSNQELDIELQNWLAAGEEPQLWWRDDDAISVTPQLKHLTRLANSANIEILLAVIPAYANEDLAAYVEQCLNLKPCIHGWSHTNHAPTSEKKCELGAHRDLNAVLADIVRGYQRLDELFGKVLLPVLVPPWNRMRDDLADRLCEVGIDAFSTYAHQRSVPEIQVNTHVDVMDWKAPGGATGKSPDTVQFELASALSVSRANGFYPIGMLSHHLVHDETAWATLSAIVAHPDLKWISFQQALAHPSTTSLSTPASVDLRFR